MDYSWIMVIACVAFFVHVFCMYRLLMPKVSLRYMALATAVMQGFFVAVIYTLMYLVPFRKKLMSALYLVFRYLFSSLPGAIWVISAFALIAVAAFSIELIPALFLFKNISKKQVIISLLVSIIAATFISGFFQLMLGYFFSKPPLLWSIFIS